VSAQAATYGRLWFDGKQWHIDATPYITMRLKRLLPRLWETASTDMWIKDTPEVARDLEWILQRHPLDISRSDKRHLMKRARQHRELEQARVEITAGTRRLELREPARPAREYQLQAADLALTTGRLLLADDVGLGKTYSSLLMLRDPDTLPAVVVTLTHLPKQWLRELEASLPWLTGHVAKKGTAYDVETDVLILNYAKLQGWSHHLAGQVKTVIFDEVQELRHNTTERYQAAQRIASGALWRMGLSATPVYNYGGEIHSILNVLAPDALGTRPEFTREWGMEMSNGHVRVSKPGDLGQYLRDEGLMLRRTRKDVKREIPDPIKVTYEVESRSDALDAIKGDVRALAELIRGSADKTERWRASGEIDWKLRQATGIDKAPFVAEFVRLLLESEEKVVLFGWHRTVYDIWLDQLAEFNPVLYTGTETTNQKAAAAEAFTNGDARVLIMSLRAGAGLDGLQHCSSVVVFGELDWSPEMHNQCIGRLARDGQENSVVAYFLVSNEGSDPVMSEVLELKRQQAEPIRDPNMPLLQPVSEAGDDRIKRMVDAVLEGSPR
jgi:SNF2 family DNA or RNA helicase